MWKNIEDLQDILAQEITVADSVNQSQQKTLETHANQIQALKSSIEGLSKIILGSMDELYNDVKSYAGRELAVLYPKMEGLSQQFLNVESSTCRTSIEMNSLRRELNDRYDFILGKIDLFGPEIRNLKQEQMLEKEDVEGIRDELRRQEEKMKDFIISTNEKIRNLMENNQKNLDSLSDLEKKVEKNLGFVQSEGKKSNELIFKKFKEYDETYQTQINTLRSSIMENMRDVVNLNELLNLNKEKINDTKIELGNKIDDFWERYDIQMKKISSCNVELEGKVEKFWGRFQEGMEDVSKSFSSRLDAFSKTIISENRVLTERMNKIDKEFDSYQRDVKSSMGVIERSLFIQDEKIAYISNSIR